MTISALSLDQITFHGQGLVRPECVLATQAGNIYTSDFRGGISQITPNGECHFFGGIEIDGVGLLKPNGICLLPDGSFLAAHLGDTTGGVYRVERNNNITPWVTELDGIPLPPSNFIYLDHQGRFWLTISTRQIPRAKGYLKDISDGFIVLIDQNGARIVADNIGYTNEVYVPPSGDKLYVNATFTRETLAFDITDTNQLTNRQVIASYDAGIYPDGLTMDEQGQLWITSIVSNSVVKVNPQTHQTSLILQDVDQAHLRWVEQAYQDNEMGRPHLDNVHSKVLKNISSLAFSGDNLSTMVLGCLLGDAIASITTKVNGIAPAHWHFDD